MHKGGQIELIEAEYKAMQFVNCYRQSKIERNITMVTDAAAKNEQMIWLKNKKLKTCSLVLKKYNPFTIVAQNELQCYFKQQKENLGL